MKYKHIPNNRRFNKGVPFLGIRPRLELERGEGNYVVEIEGANSAAIYFVPERRPLNKRKHFWRRFDTADLGELERWCGLHPESAKR